jgi:hypothetical protein
MYKLIQFEAGDRISDAVATLTKYHQLGKLVKGSFNGKMLYSDVDDLDSAYKKIMGMTKSEYEAVNEKHVQQIPQLTALWVEKGKFILDEEYHELWVEIVPIRLADLYKGAELGATLAIIKELNANKSFREVLEILESQGHSGLSFHLVCRMISTFCKRGSAFATFANRI